jgi:hypothetical protein
MPGAELRFGLCRAPCRPLSAVERGEDGDRWTSGRLAVGDDPRNHPNGP